MAQRTVEFLKRVGLQLITGYSIGDEQAVLHVQSILNNGIDTGDTIVDAEMPTTQLGVTLDWSAGTPNDLTVYIEKSGVYVTQDLTAANSALTVPLGFEVLTMNGGDTLGSGDTRLNPYDSVIFGNYLVIFGNSGRTISYNYSTETWYLPGDSGGITNDGSVLGGSAIWVATIYDSDIVVAGANGRIGSFDGTNWKNYDGSGTGTGPYHSGLLGGTQPIYSMIEYDSKLIFGNATGQTGYWNGSTWYDYDTAQPSIAQDGYIVYEYPNNQSINDFAVLGTDLIAVCGNGKVASWDGSNWAIPGGARAEVTEIQCANDDEGSYGGTYWILNSATDATTYWVWYDVDDGSTPPTPTGGETLAEVNISADDEGDTIATNTASVINALSDFSASSDYVTVTVTNAATGFTTDAENVDSDVNISVTTQGAPSSGTGPTNNGTAMTDNIDVAHVFDGDVIIAGIGGQVASWDGSNWKNYDGTGSGTGPYNSGTATGSQRIKVLATFGTNLVVAGDSGRVAYWNGSSWTNYDTTQPSLSNNSTAVGTQIIKTAQTVSGDFVIMAEQGRIASWDSSNWKNYDGTGSGTGIYNEIYISEDNLMVSTIYDDNYLVIGTVTGKISSYDFSGASWNAYDDAGEGPWNDGTATNSEQIVALKEYNGNLVVMTYYGKVASFDGTNWKNYDGSGTGTGPYDDGSGLGSGLGLNMHVYSYSGSDYLVICGYLGRISSFDGSNWKYYDGSGTGTGPYDNNTLGIGWYFSMTTFEDKLVVGGQTGVGNWNGTAWTTGSGGGAGVQPYDNGTAMGSLTIYTMTTYDSSLVLAGSGARIASYSTSGGWVPYTTSHPALAANANVILSSWAGTPNIPSIATVGDYLIVAGSYAGTTASWDGSHWKKDDGSSDDGDPGSATGPWNDGSALGEPPYTSLNYIANNFVQPLGDGFYILGADERIASWYNDTWYDYDT